MLDKLEVNGPVMSEFVLDSKSKFKFIMGPLGSGKTTACIADLANKINQISYTKLIRDVRILVVRNTYSQLRDSVIPDWLKWIKGGIYIGGDTNIWRMDWNSIYGPKSATLMFRSLDVKKDLKKIKSANITHAYINELSTVPFGIASFVLSRCGRHPSAPLLKSAGISAQLIADSNPPTYDHWIYHTFVKKKLEIGDEVLENFDKWKIYKQPGGLDDDAENIENLPEDYYEDMVSENLIAERDGEFSTYDTNRRIYPEYKPTLHNGKNLSPSPRWTIIVGIDFGLNCSAIFGYRENRQWKIFKEIYMENSNLFVLCEKMKEELSRYDYYEFWVDPAGFNRDGKDGRSYVTVLEEQMAAPVYAISNNKHFLRKQPLKELLRATKDGEAYIKIDYDNCPLLCKGLGGGYHYRQLKTSWEGEYSPQPVKNSYSHIVEALEYLISSNADEIVYQYKPNIIKTRRKAYEPW